MGIYLPAADARQGINRRLKGWADLLGPLPPSPLYSDRPGLDGMSLKLKGPASSERSCHCRHAADLSSRMPKLRHVLVNMRAKGICDLVFSGTGAHRFGDKLIVHLPQVNSAK
ncbi:hypothetical protein QUC32_27560 (plasmid) [Novosphingobium resinovorum]|uniref:hypothetical protein n=1 Tax=Novosphingobium TaxID=165696 RepID=UPI001B3C6F11|nr:MULTISPECIES: hypothetical protein [Novosphingobium]MBF7015453.1 hypothetical protein [Novosphingobium sp. HR1a]WJM30387.1 hypothetical protein QUC32_27560 [Novosphingobium resinovorum]